MRIPPPDIRTPAMPVARLVGACLSLALAVAAATMALTARQPAAFSLLLLAMAALAAGLLAGWLWLIRPLASMLRALELTRRTGRLPALPNLPGEAGTLGEGISRLASQAEVQRRKLVDSVLDLQRLNEELDHLAHVKDDFLMAINHQFRTPLTTLKEGLSLFRDGTLGTPSAEAREMLEVMGQGTERLAHLIEDLLDLSLLKSGRRPLLREPADLAALLQRAQARWQDQAGDRPITISCETLPPAYLDPLAMQEVLDHLIRNALRHAAAQSAVTIQGRGHEGRARVVVTNRGPGLTSAQAAQLFQPFAHVHTPDAPGSEGSGLGLAFCRQVLERHHGSIGMERDEAAQETRMVLELPLATPAFLLEEALRAAQDTAGHEGGAFGIVLALADAQTMERAAPLLRQNTARRDAFVRLEPGRLAIVAVAAEPGLAAMRRRLARVLAQGGLRVALGIAGFPADGERPEHLLAAAEQRAPQGEELHATIPRPSPQPGEAYR